MSTDVSATRPLSSRVLHWLGCLLGTAVVAMFLVFAFGGHEAPPPLNPQTVSLALMLVGFLVAWWNDLAGGLISLLGLGCFHGVEIAAKGQMAGGFFQLFWIPGALCLLAWLLARPDSMLSRRYKTGHRNEP
jgi:hypothetical protein